MIDDTNPDEEMMYEFGAAAGDPRRCPRHPEQVTSSPDGMHDAPCDACEFEMEEYYGANDRFEQSEEGTPAPEPEDDPLF